MSRVIVFDVNETLLDLKALDEPFKNAFGDGAVRGQWFAQMLATAYLTTLTGQYHDFAAAGRAALSMVARRRGVKLTDEQSAAILGTVRRLPAHPEVPAALQRFKAAGLRLATLTNSPPAVVAAQLESSGLAKYFEAQLSVDSVRAFKPAPAPYLAAAKSLGVPVGQVRLVAAHDWDVAGAMAAGCAAAFVARPGMVLNPLFPVPDIVGRDMTEVAELIIKAETRR